MGSTNMAANMLTDSPIGALAPGAQQFLRQDQPYVRDEAPVFY